MNARRLPSGDHRGEFSVFSPPTSSFGAPEPSAGTAQMSALRLPVGTSVIVRTNTTVLPSGESCGSETRTAPSRSAMVIGRAAKAETADRKTAAADAAAYQYFMTPIVVG